MIFKTVSHYSEVGLSIYTQKVMSLVTIFMLIVGETLRSIRGLNGGL